MKSEVRRPVLRYHGGKWRLASWIIEHFPEHKIYVEPFGGAASVLLRKQPSFAEVYNDLDGGVVELFRVLRDEASAARLIELLRLTPFARQEFSDAYEQVEEPIENARRLVIRSFMGFGSDGINRKVRTGFRANSNRSHTTPAHDWANFPDSLYAVVERLQGIVIEQAPALEVIERFDRADALFYVDPPYVPHTRSMKSRRGGDKYHGYTHEMDEADHERLAEALHGAKGMVLLSGYHSPLYDRLFADWARTERRCFADGAVPRVEVLWMNQAAFNGRWQGQANLFEGVPA